MRQVKALVLIVIGVVALSACGGGGSPKASGAPAATPIDDSDYFPDDETTTTIAPKDVEVLESSFYESTEADGFSAGQVAWVVVLENPNAELVAVDVEVKVTFLDANDKPLHTADDRVYEVLPGTKAAAGNLEYDGAEGTAKLRTSVKVSHWKPLERTGAFEVRDVTTNVNGRRFLVSGTVTSTFDAEVDEAFVFVVARDATGKALRVRPDDVALDAGEAQFTIELETLPGVADADVYVQPSFGF